MNTLLCKSDKPSPQPKSGYEDNSTYITSDPGRVFNLVLVKKRNKNLFRIFLQFPINQIRLTGEHDQLMLASLLAVSAFSWTWLTTFHLQWLNCEEKIA